MPALPTLEDVKRLISGLNDADRKAVYDFYCETYCVDCGAYALCDCPKCVCKCRRRRGAGFYALYKKIAEEQPGLPPDEVLKKAGVEFRYP
jgi:hypothetical protein